MRYSRLVVAFAAAGLGACVVGPPVGFSPGSQWTFPLVDPLDDDVLVTPVMIDGFGPYLFVIDPDANISAVDTQVVSEAHLRTGKGPRRVDEAGAQVERVYAEVLDMKVGTLTISKRPAMVFPVGLYDTNGRHFAGVIGRDVIDDRLVFGFDRDRGLAMLSTEKAFQPPEHSVDFSYRPVASQMADLEVRPVPRRLARVQVNGELYSMHLDLGAVLSQLRESHWATAGLTAVPAELKLVDEAGTARTVGELGTARTVVLAAATRNGVAFVPFDDARWDTEGVEGALGLGFFAPFSVWMSWERATCYLAVRGDLAATAAARLGRWGSAVPRCTHPGCVTAAAALPATPAADAAPGTADVTITVTRDPEAAKHSLQVVLAPVPAAGQPALGWLVANLPPEADQVSGRIGAGYAGATLQVIDVSPFPRGCAEGLTGCIALFAPVAPAGPAGPAGPSPPATVTPDKLHRLTGDAVIAPGDAARQAIAAAGAPPAIAVVRLCLTADGKVDSVRMIKTTKVPAYDEQLLADIKSTWAFEPYIADGNPAAVCTSVTLKAP